MTIPDRPDEALLVGWHQLAVHGTDLAGSVDVHHACVQAVAAAVGCALHDPNVNRDRVFTCNLDDPLEVTGLDAHGLFHVVTVEIFLQV